MYIKTLCFCLMAKKRNMVATVEIKEITGPEGSPVYTLKDTSHPSRYYTADLPDEDSTAYPIPIPDTGTNRSFWKSHCLDITVGPDTYIRNVRYYQTWNVDPHTDWSLGTDGDLIVGVSSTSVDDCRVLSQGCPQEDYDQATGTVGLTGDPIETTHAYYSNTAAKFKSITNFSSQSSALMVQSGQVVGAGETGKSYIVVTQVIVGPGATQGIKPDKTATFVYDEA